MDINSLPHHILSSANVAIHNNVQNNSKLAEKETRAIAFQQEKKATSLREENVNKNDQPVEKTSEIQDAETNHQQIITQLKARDREVKAHEAAHLAAAGQYATGGANYSYTTGPDGRQYANGGEVGIDTSPISNDPQATLVKAQQVQRAALAPAKPSAQDRSVASQASQMAMQARQDIAEEKLEKNKETSPKQNEENLKSANSSSNTENKENPLQPFNQGLRQEQNQFQIRNLLAS